MREVSGLHSDWLIGLPFLAEEPGLGWVAITEADIDNYAGMYLRKDKRFLSHRSRRTCRRWRIGRVVRAGSCRGDRNAVQQSVARADDRRRAGKLIESNMVLNLNPPSKIADTSWIRRASRRGTGGRARPRPA